MANNGREDLIDYITNVSPFDIYPLDYTARAMSVSRPVSPLRLPITRLTASMGLDYSIENAWKGYIDGEFNTLQEWPNPEHFRYVRSFNGHTYWRSRHVD